MVEYYSSRKKNAIVPFATAWMDLETVILSGVKPGQMKAAHSSTGRGPLLPGFDHKYGSQVLSFQLLKSKLYDGLL